MPNSPRPLPVSDEEFAYAGQLVYKTFDTTNDPVVSQFKPHPYGRRGQNIEICLTSIPVWNIIHLREWTPRADIPGWPAVDWTTKWCTDAKKRLKKFAKKWPHEIKNVVDNLDTLVKSLECGTKPEQVKTLGFVHSEPDGILAIDQSGPGKGARLKALRLYVFPCEKESAVYVLILGDKSLHSQSEDIKLSRVFVSGLMQRIADDPRNQDDDI